MCVFMGRPTSLLLGMNRFLKSLEITFRRDSQNYRPRINKLHSVKVCLCMVLFIVFIKFVFVVFCRMWNRRDLEIISF